MLGTASGPIAVRIAATPHILNDRACQNSMADEGMQNETKIDENKTAYPKARKY